MAKYFNLVDSFEEHLHGEKEALSSSNLIHNLDKNCCSSAMKKTRRCIFLYFTQTVHFLVLNSE